MYFQIVFQMHGEDYDRMLKKNGIDKSEISPISRLAIVGDLGTGALCYRPNIELKHGIENSFNKDFDKLAEDCAKVLQSKDVNNLDELYQFSGSSGGARPKINIVESDSTWLVKFPSTGDFNDIGFIEMKYMECANACGIPVVEHKLFPSIKCRGYFGSKRFDIVKGIRQHMLTAAAIFEADYRTPCLEYENLIKLAGILSMNSTEEKEKMYRLMCFNILAHNQDDHAKNFTFIYDEDEDLWRMAPAYDLTYSNTYYGEQTTTLNGKGRDFELEDFLSAASVVGISKKNARNIYDDIYEKVSRMLANLRF